MKKLSGLGKWLFIIPFACFGLLHFGPLEFSLPYVPTWLPYPAFWVYLIGACLILVTISATAGKFDKLASVCLALLMLIFVVVIHLPKAFSGDFLGVIATFRDTCMAGAALIYAGVMARDNRLIG